MAGRKRIVGEVTLYTLEGEMIKATNGYMYKFSKINFDISFKYLP